MVLWFDDDVSSMDDLDDDKRAWHGGAATPVPTGLDGMQNYEVGGGLRLV